MDVLGHVPLEITSGILPAPGGSMSDLEEEELPILGEQGWRWPSKPSLDAGRITQKVAGKGREPWTEVGSNPPVVVS